MTNIYASRQEAIQNKGNKYIGKVCNHCAGTIRYVNGGCINCAKTKARAHDKAHPEKHRQRTKKWRVNNPDQTKATAKLWCERNPDKVKSKLKKWRKNHPKEYLISRQVSRAKRRSREYQADGSHKTHEWIVLKDKYENVCLRCKKSENQIIEETGVGLTPDHVIPLKTGGSNNIANIQPLCLPCNRLNYIHSLRYGKQVDYRS